MLRALAALIAALLLVACGGSDGAPQAPRPLVVFGAASATDALESFAAAGRAVPLRLSVGASSTLARQIEAGAPADVFVSASRRWVERLAQRGLLAGPPRVLARNRLVLIAAPGRGGRLTALSELPDWLGGRQLGVADEGVPAGEYARQALAAAHVLEPLRPRLVGLADVRAVLRAVAMGELSAGIVYRSDLRAAEVQTLLEIDPALHRPIELVGAALAGSRSPVAAVALLEELAADADGRFAAAGLEPAE